MIRKLIRGKRLGIMNPVYQFINVLRLLIANDENDERQTTEKVCRRKKKEKKHLENDPFSVFNFLLAVLSAIHFTNF